MGNMNIKTDLVAGPVEPSVIPMESSGILAGSIIMTMRGEVPIEALKAGDRIITRDAGMAVINDVKIAEIQAEPIMIMAGSLGHTRPDKDMMIAPDTRVHIRDWRAKAIFGADQATVPARRLVDGEFVRKGDMQTLITYQIKMDMPHIIYVDGLEVSIS